MSALRKCQDTAGLQALAVVPTNIWYIQSFVRLLQLVIHWLRTSGFTSETKQTSVWFVTSLIDGCGRFSRLVLRFEVLP